MCVTGGEISGDGGGAAHPTGGCVGLDMLTEAEESNRSSSREKKARVPAKAILLGELTQTRGSNRSGEKKAGAAAKQAAAAEKLGG